MDSRALKKKTTVYEMASIEASAFDWQVGKVERVDVNGVAGLVFSERFKPLIHETVKSRSLADLKTEFFNHQLLECDTTDEESLIRFVEKWGIPFSPYRFDHACIPLLRCYTDENGYSHKYPKSLRRMHSDAVKNTDKLLEKFNEYLKFESASLDEVRATVELLQHFVRTLHAAIRARDEADRIQTADFMINCKEKKAAEWRAYALKNELGGFARAINSAACYPLQLPVRYVDSAFPRGLTSAICNQIVDTLGDQDTPWRACKNKECSVIFKRRQSDDVDVRPNRSAVYCCDACLNRQKQRDKYERDKDKKAAQPKGSEHKEATKGGVDNG